MYFDNKEKSVLEVAVTFRGFSYLRHGGSQSLRLLFA
jgi:hypothetical protein